MKINSSHHENNLQLTIDRVAKYTRTRSIYQQA